VVDLYLFIDFLVTASLCLSSYNIRLIVVIVIIVITTITVQRVSIKAHCRVWNPNERDGSGRWLNTLL